MKNPVKTSRLQAGLSLHDLANMTGMTKTTILRVEAGQHDSIPDPIISTLELTIQDLEAYHEFRIWKRSIQSLNPFPAHTHIHATRVNPFMKWLEVSRRSINSFANDFCLPYSLVQNFCQHPEQYFQPPVQLVNALLSSKTSIDDIEHFLDFYGYFYEALSAGALKDGPVGPLSLKVV